MTPLMHDEHVGTPAVHFTVDMDPACLGCYALSIMTGTGAEDGSACGTEDT